MKVAIVNGANGFVATGLIPELVRSSIQVIATVRSAASIDKDSYLRKSGVTLVEGELESLYLKIKPILNDGSNEDCVFYNCVWSGGAGLTDGGVGAQMDNVVRSTELVKLASSLGCGKFVNIGSAEEDQMEDYLKTDWRKLPYPYSHSDYAVAKLSARDQGRLEGYLSKIDYIHTRFSSVLSMNLTGKGYIQDTVKNILNKKGYSEPNSGALFNIISREDLSRALVCIGKYGKNQANYFIGYDYAVTLKDLFQFLKRVVDSKGTLGEDRFGLKKSKSPFLEYSCIKRDCRFDFSDDLEEFLKGLVGI